MAKKTPAKSAAAVQQTGAHAPARVAVLDAGGQYVDLVRKAIERQGVPAEVLPLQTPRADLEAAYAAIVISGSPASSHAEAAPQPDAALWSSALPILGICYGMQAMVVAAGGSVARNAIREDGRVTTIVDTAHPLFKGIKKEFTGLFTHGDFVKKLPAGFTAIGQHSLSDGSVAYSAIARIGAADSGSPGGSGTLGSPGNKLGVQFHPEVFDDTPEGYQLFKNFLFGVAGLQPDEDFREARLGSIIETKRQQIARQVGGRHVIAFVSGGVDSSVTATLAAAVIAADKFHAFYIDNGFMRDEDDMVIDALNAAGIQVSKVDATETFEEATAVINGEAAGPLKYTADPEAKRKLIGKTFIDVQNNLVTGLKLKEALLLQGTNAADRIESGHSTGGHTETIKTHHNQVQEVQELKARGLLLEPIDDLFKDEIRAIGHELGLPHDLVERQPFPGPGLAIRIIAAAESQPALERIPIEDRIRQFVAGHPFDTTQPVTAHVLPVRSVGVGGDERSHISVVAIDNAGLSTADMAALAHDIPAHFRGEVNRIIYALGPQEISERSITKTLLTADVREQLRRADRIVFEAMRSFDVLGKIKQMPVVLLPLAFGKAVSAGGAESAGEPGQRSIVLRPVTTSTFMTVQAMLPGRDLPEEFFTSITGRILAEVPGITQVFLDLTNKPPGTTEWE